MRLLGVGLSGFDTPDEIQRSLFEDQDRQKRSQLDAVSDEIQAKFGTGALGRASGLLHEARHQPVPRPDGKNAQGS